MRRIGVTVVLVVAIIGQVAAKRFYVKHKGTGDGTSWAQAYGDLQRALAVAVAGDEVWVAAGTYMPTQGTDQTVSFRIPSGVRVLGGFNGSETLVTARNWEANKTYLSGNIGALRDSSDNTNTLIYFEHAAPTTVLDGFFIVDAVAKGFVRGIDLSVVGAAVFNNGARGKSSPTIQNCVFKGNLAREGAAIYNYANNGECRPTIKNCHFIANKADINGGAIYNNGDNGICAPRISDCYFVGNWSIYGASMLNSGENGTCRPTIERCTFTENRTAMSGSVVFNNRTKNGVVHAALNACEYKNNVSTTGTDIENNKQN